jgi:hypothetical protein
MFYAIDQMNSVPSDRLDLNQSSRAAERYYATSVHEGVHDTQASKTLARNVLHHLRAFLYLLSGHSRRHHPANALPRCLLLAVVSLWGEGLCGVDKARMLEDK